jgi:hypothetical protein
MFFLKKKFYYPLFSLIIGIIISCSIWDYIALEFKNEEEIIGEYSKNLHHSLNDTLRYIFFISFPLTLFFITFFLTKNESHYENISIKLFITDFNKKYSDRGNLNNLYFIFFITFLFFISKNFSIGLIDIFESGISLSGSILFENGLKPWEEVYINTGFFYDMFLAKLSWILTDFKTIGSYVIFKQFLNLLTLIFLIYLFYIISQSLDNQFTSSNFFLIISFFLILFVGDANIWRDLPLIVFLISALKYINSKELIWILIISFFCVFTLLWSLDRGFFLIFLSIPFFLLVLINHKIEFIKFLIIIFLICFFIFLIVDNSILNNFFRHTHDIFVNHEKLNGIIHPKPFSEDQNSTRATKSLLIILLNLIISILIILKKDHFFKYNTKFIFLFFSIMNFISYKSALSRSDGPHIKEATSFSIMLLVCFFLIFLLNYISKNKKIKKNNKKIKLTYVLIFLFILFNNRDFINIKKIPKNIKELVNASDEKFLDKDYNKSIRNLSKFFADEKCLQAFSYDQAIFYLMKKKSCSKFYNVWVIGSKKNQLKYIEELKNNSPKYLLKGGKINFQNLEERYPYIGRHISKNYKFYKKIDTWDIFIKTQ